MVGNSAVIQERGYGNEQTKLWACCRPYGSNRQERCPKSSAISIGLRSRTLATVAERICHSHPALTVAGATRRTCGERGANGFFLFRLTCSNVSADTAPTFPVQ